VKTKTSKYVKGKSGSLVAGTNRHPPHLRLVIVNEEPRKYAQSTSGRVSSTGTAPPLSLASEIASPSRMRSLVDKTLRRYPIVVPQRSAKDDCSSISSELRYMRNDSMAQTVPLGTFKSIPVGHLPSGIARYAGAVGAKSQKEIFEIRRGRLRHLVGEFGKGVNVAFAKEVENRASSHPTLADDLTAFMDASYVGRALKGTKNVGEEPSHALEVIFEKPSEWMSSLDPRPVGWPFKFSRDLWDSLDPEQREKAEEQLFLYVTGVHTVSEEKKRARRKTGT
jgi:hypothetical protein